MKASVYLSAALALTLVLFGTGDAYAQEAGPNIISLSGKAEILERGRRTPARQGHTLQPGQTIELVGGGEVSLAMDNDRIKVKVVDGSSVRYDGYVPANSQPWSAATPAVRQAASGESAPQFSAQKGRMEVEVAPGQQLRIVSPLILAAVRGTKFTVTVDFDGTSRVDTSEGRVATYGRNGEIRLATPTQSAVVTAKEYGAFLESQGARIPRGGTWRDVPAATQERVDSETVGAAFQPGGDILVAVLANPNASPTSGVQALALDVSSAEPGSIFAMETTEPSSVNTAARVLPVASEIDPQSTLLDEGLPDIQAPTVIAPQLAYVIGTFDLTPLIVNPSDVLFNKFIFDLDLSTGEIPWAGFDISYYNGARQTEFWSGGGRGHLNLNTLAFNIGNFDPVESEYFENTAAAGFSEGYLNSGTVMYGSLTGPLNLGSSTATGQVDLAYTSTNSITPSVMPTSVTILTGLLDEKPLYGVEGHLTPPVGVSTVYGNWFEFTLNGNNGIISDADMYLDYNDSSMNFVQLKLERGSGSVSSGTFTVNFPSGIAQSTSTAYSAALTGNMAGSFSSDPAVHGTQVTGGSLSLSYGSTPPAFFPTSPIAIDDGQVNLAGR
ncbi:MAG: FecR domain-containing protein [Deltaproteobacteria bacterium]|nr:FecR domain-containing protein [Deltaproteobacteria bacterium]